MTRFAALFLAVVVFGALASAAFADSQRAVCPGPVAHGAARCHAHVVTDDRGKPLARPTPSQAALGPQDLWSAYNLAGSAQTLGAGKTIAIVDAYHYPTAEADLATYRSTYGLPPCTSTPPAGGGPACFRQVSQTGGTNYPATSANWAQEEALDLDMASAICPNCNIVLVEANSAYMTDLGASVNEAVALGANVVSNSYGGSEYSSETADENAYYKHPDVAITVSSGDAGYGPEFPAASQYVTAVGGTTLTKATSTTRGWTETAWSGAGSGCSRYVSKPSWQSDSGCTNRTIADVSADANPSTGVAVYDSTPYQNASGWLKFGGTSVAAPLIGGVYALSSTAGTPASLAYPPNSGTLFDITSGSNGRCGSSYLCTAKTGYDGPTGMGSPNGLSAF
jgi:subtilase family serine protease